MPPDPYFACSLQAGGCLTVALKLLFTGLTDYGSRHMTVQDVAGSTQQTVGRPTEHPLRHARGNAFSRETWLRCRMAKILESGARSAPAVLEMEQPLIAPIGTSHIEIQKAALLRFLDGLPHQQLHRSKSVESRIGAPVFIGHRTFVADREDAGSGLVFLGSEPNSDSIPIAGDQVSKPGQWLWG
jgi:hypothetical protein